MNVIVIGVGSMGFAYAEGMTKSSMLGNEKIKVYDANPDRMQALKQDDRFDVISDLLHFMPKADIIFFAVKPFHSEALFKTIQPVLKADQIIVSLMAGITIETIQLQLKTNKIVRAMPNLPVSVGNGVTAFTTSVGLEKNERNKIQQLLETTGCALHVDNERFIDASTSISGSGPAYVFYFMQSMIETAQEMGFSEADAKLLVEHTFKGAIELYNKSNTSPKAWIEEVTSAGGTTEAAINFMEKNNVKQLINKAAFAAFNRAIELGEINSFKNN